MSAGIKDIVSAVCCNRWCEECPLKIGPFPDYICSMPSRNKKEIMSALNEWNYDTDGMFDEKFRIALGTHDVIKKDLLAVINQSEDVDFI